MSGGADDGSGLHPRADTLEQQLRAALELHGRSWDRRDAQEWRRALRAIIRASKRLGYVERMIEEQRARLLGQPAPTNPWDGEDTPTVLTGRVKG